LPPGLLADASIDGGACVRSQTPLAACKDGTGTVTATTWVWDPEPQRLLEGRVLELGQLLR